MKPEFFRSRSLAKLPRDVRMTFVGMWIEADDHGNGIADERLLKGSIWPLDDDIQPVHISAFLDMLAASGHISLYEVDGETYFHVISFEKHQAAAYRRGEPKFPQPSAGQSLEPRPALQIVQESADSTLKRAVTGNREQGTGTSSNSKLDKKAIDEKFAEFWSVYPRREAKKGAQARFARAIKDGVDPEVIVSGAKRYAAYLSSTGRDRDMTKLPTTWLNQGCWDDELQGGTVSAVVVPIGDHRAWLQEMWRTGDVASICNITTLAYEEPDLPDHVTTKAEGEAFSLQHRRDWINANHEEILTQLSNQEAA